MMRALASVGAAIVLALALTACAVHGQVTTGTPPPPATAGPAPGSATSSTFGSGETLAYDCRQLVGAEALAQLDPGLAPESDLLAANNSPTEEALALRGTVCAWSDESAAIVLVVTAAKPDAPTFATLKEKASTGRRDAEFGGSVTAFTTDEQLQLFTRHGYWVTVASALLADPAKRTAIGQTLLEKLPAG
jgi:hypothetical protein